jgi:hypothetical protein
VLALGGRRPECAWGLLTPDERTSSDDESLDAPVLAGRLARALVGRAIVRARATEHGELFLQFRDEVALFVTADHPARGQWSLEVAGSIWSGGRGRSISREPEAEA